MNYFLAQEDEYMRGGESLRNERIVSSDKSFVFICFTKLYYTF